MSREITWEDASDLEWVGHGVEFHHACTGRRAVAFADGYAWYENSAPVTVRVLTERGVSRLAVSPPRAFDSDSDPSGYSDDPDGAGDGRVPTPRQVIEEVRAAVVQFLAAAEQDGSNGACHGPINDRVLAWFNA
jgi:hypothetical protein